MKTYYRFDKDSFVYLGFVVAMDGAVLSDLSYYTEVSPQDAGALGMYLWDVSTNTWKDKE